MNSPLTEEEIEILAERLTPMQNNAFERHAQTALTSLVVLLLAGVVAFIFKINDNQIEQLIEIRALQYQVKAIADTQAGGNNILNREVARLDYSINTIWPRLRSMSENLEVLRRELERLHGIELNFDEPEKF